jgi:hypothetical protein
VKVLLLLGKKFEKLDEKCEKLNEERWKLEKKCEMLEKKCEKLEKKCEKLHESSDDILATFQNNAWTRRVRDIVEAILEVKESRQQPQCQQAGKIEQDNNGKPRNINFPVPSLEEEEVDDRDRHSFPLATVEENTTCSSEFSSDYFETDAANCSSPPSAEEVMEVQSTDSDMRPLPDSQSLRDPQYTEQFKTADSGPIELFVDRAHTKTVGCSNGVVMHLPTAIEIQNVVLPQRKARSDLSGIALGRCGQPQKCSTVLTGQPKNVPDEQDRKIQTSSKWLTPKGMIMCTDTFKHHTGPGPPFHCSLVSTSRPGPESDVLLNEAIPSLSDVHPPEGVSFLHEEEHVDCNKYYEALIKQPVGQKSTPKTVTILYTLAGLSTDVKTPPTGKTAAVQHTYRQPIQRPLTCSDWAEEEQSQLSSALCIEKNVLPSERTSAVHYACGQSARLFWPPLTCSEWAEERQRNIGD